MELKYKELISEQNLSIQCPPSGCRINSDDLEAARWVVTPLESEFNFIPNHLYNMKRGVPTRPMKEDLKCDYCGLSFFETVEASVLHYHNFTAAIQSKLGYTHVAKGVIKAGWGLVTKANESSRHFELFEKEGNDWIENFQMAAKL